jgi:glycosyltransferase involved in cell wall biosynthesis
MPTFDHGPLLLRSVASVLAQTVADVELFIVGDGVSDATRAIVAELARDPRVRFFDNRAKGEHHGEVYRHAALREARGRIVCYCADDDLWLPDHVATMRELLDGADFAHTLPFQIERDGSFRVLPLDLAQRTHRWLIGGRPRLNRIPLSMGGHTLEHYRRLPHGWRTTPRGTSVPLYTWQQILRTRPCRARSGFRPTVLHFPSLYRKDATIEQRLAEIDVWVERARDSAWVDRLRATLAEAPLRDAARRAVPADLASGVLLSVFPFPATLGKVKRLLRGGR